SNHGNKARNKNGVGEAKGKAYVLGGGDANPDSNVVKGTFLLNNHYAFILFDSGADRSFVSTTFSTFLDITPDTLDVSYVVELAYRRISETNIVLRGYTLGLLGHPFNIDLMMVKLGSFDAIIDMDWLANHHAVSVCDEKIMWIPYGDEVLIVEGDGEAAFQLLKQKLCSAPILALPEGSENFVVYCDVSHKGLGALEPRADGTLCLNGRSWIPCRENRLNGEVDETILEGSSLEAWSASFDYFDRDSKFTSHFWKSLNEALDRLFVGLRIQAAQDRQKSYADRRRKPLEFEVGDKVMLKVSPWKGVIRFGKRGKLNPRYIGPFRIIAKVGTLAYRLELLEQLSRVHSTFHVSNLKKCFVDEPLAIPLEEIQIDDKLHFIEEPVEIMDREVKRLKQSRIPIIKV
ncbi:putative reverse transcriptase domain-containing protein, partial [Tanacetum coccineum]